MGMIPICDGCGVRMDGNRPVADTNRSGHWCAQCAGTEPDDRERVEVPGDLGRPGAPDGEVSVFRGERCGRRRADY